jgi:cellulose biosynthesis protein BcsQ
MAKPAVIPVGADKGGVGKTTVSRTLLDYFASRKVPTRAFDTEPPSLPGFDQKERQILHSRINGLHP